MFKGRCRAPTAALLEVAVKVGTVVEKEAAVRLTEAATAAEEAINRKRMEMVLLLSPRLGLQEETTGRLVLLCRAVQCMLEVLELRWGVLEWLARKPPVRWDPRLVLLRLLQIVRRHRLTRLRGPGGAPIPFLRRQVQQRSLGVR